MIPSQDFETTVEADMMELGIILFEMYFGKPYTTSNDEKKNGKIL